MGTSLDPCHCQTCIIVVESVLLLNPCCCCWICIVVVESMLLLLNPHHHCWIHTMVVKSVLLLLNPCYGCCGRIHVIWLLLLWHPNLWHCWTCIMVVKSALLWLNLCCCGQICIGVVESISSGFHHCDIPTCGIVGLISWLSNLHYCYWICIIQPSLLNTWYCHQTCVVVVHCPDLDMFAGHLWRLVCAENESERSGKKIMGNENTPCSCDSPSQSSLIANPAQILAQELKDVGPHPSARGGACVRTFEVVLSSRHLQQVNVSPHPSARGGAHVG